MSLLLLAPTVQGQEEGEKRKEAKPPASAEGAVEEEAEPPGADEEAAEEEAKPPKAAEKAAEEEESPPEVRLHGDLRTRYVVRVRGSESDQDMYQSLRSWGDFGEDRRLRFLLHGLLTWDMDGRVGDESFADRGNTFGSNTHGYLYSAHAELRDTPQGLLERVRVGRQFLYVPETIHLDGATVETATWKGFSARGQVGIPVHLYDGSRQGDFTTGGGLSYSPWKWLRLGADYAHIRDDPLHREERVDDLYSTNALVRIGTHTRVGGRTSWIDGQFRRVEGRVFSHWDGPGLLGGVRFIYQPETLREFSTMFSPLYQVLLERRPYYHIHLFAEKEITTNFDVEIGGMTRQLLDDDDEGTFNREFSRTYVTLHAVDLPVEKVTASLTGEVWLTEADDIWSLGGDIQWRPAPRWKVSTGYYYSLFKIDRVTLEERERVETVYVRGTGPLVGPLSFLAQYELEWDGGPVYHVVETAVTLRF